MTNLAPLSPADIAAPRDDLPTVVYRHSSCRNCGQHIMLAIEPSWPAYWWHYATGNQHCKAESPRD